MRTIGRRYSGPSRNWQEMCDYCGAQWLRSDLTLDPQGYLACPDDRDGRTVKEIDYQRAGDSSEPCIVRGKTREGAM